MNKEQSMAPKNKVDKIIRILVDELNTGKPPFRSNQRLFKRLIYSSVADRQKNLESTIKLMPLIFAANEKNGISLVGRIVKDLSINSFSRQDVLFELSKSLEYSTCYVGSQSEKSSLVETLYVICFALFSQPEARAIGRHKAFGNLSSDKKWSQYYSEQISNQLLTEIDFARTGSCANSNRIEFLCDSLNDFLKAEFRFTEAEEKLSVTICSYVIKPGNLGWNPRSRLIEYIKEHIFDLPTNVANTFSDCLERFIGDYNRSNQGDQRDSTFKEYITSQFRWYLNVPLKSANKMSGHAIRRFRSSWHWFLEWSNDEELKSLAQECELAYFGESNYDRYKALVNYQDRVFAQQVESEIAEEVIANNSPEYFRKILHAVHRISEHPTESHQYFGLITKVCSHNSFIDSALDFVMSNLDSEVDRPFIQIAENCVLKWHRSNKSGKLAKILDTIATKAESPAEHILNFYSSIHPSIVGEFTIDDLNFIENLSDTTLLFESLIACTTLASTHWESAIKIVDNKWGSITPNQQSTLVFLMTEKMNQHMLINECKISSNKMEWLIRKFFSLFDMDSAANCSYSFKRLAIKSDFSLSIGDLGALLEQRFNESNLTNHNKKLPRRFTEIYQVFKPSKSSKSISEFSKVIGFYLARKHEQWILGKIFPGIDPSGDLVAEALKGAVDRINGYNDLVELARIAGYYPDTAPGWERIAQICIDKSEEFPGSDINQIFSAIRWNGVRSYSGRIDEIAPQYLEELEHAHSRLLSSPSFLVDFWKQEIRFCTSAIEQAKSELSTRLKGFA